MSTITHYVCGVIPPHMLDWMSEQDHAREGGDIPAGENARATVDHMRDVATGRARTLIGSAPPSAQPRHKCLHVYDARQTFQLPGNLARGGYEKSDDLQVEEAWEGSGATYDFFADVFGRNSIDDRGMRIDSTVHYGTRFGNAMWNGEQIVYGDGDGRIFTRFTASLNVIAHELMHGITQFSASLGYFGETGALNEHLSDAFGKMVEQYTLHQSAHDSDWLIGSELLGSDVNGIAVRSMAAPGTAYDDEMLGRDPQPWHMRDYVHTDTDNGGVHINSGILNHGFYLAAQEIGGYPWEVLGRIWYAVVTRRLKPHAGFFDFARATVEIAGQMFGSGGRIQRAVRDAWAKVGLSVKPGNGACSVAHVPTRRPPERAAASVNTPKWHHSIAR